MQTVLFFSYILVLWSILHPSLSLEITCRSRLSAATTARGGPIKKRNYIENCYKPASVQTKPAILFSLPAILGVQNHIQ